MCGIVGYVGAKKAAPLLIEGLRKLEYRGYDSWGIALLNQGKIKITKQVGAIGDLASSAKLPKANLGIGHTRWATTGAVTQKNAHPHYATDKSFVLAQNGIVENYQELKDKLKKQHYQFESETDTEVIVRLIENELKKNKQLLEAIRKAFAQLRGRNTIIILTQTGDIYACRNGSPLIIGYNSQTRETFVSSDTLSFAPYVDKIQVVDNQQLVVLEHKKPLRIIKVTNGQKQTVSLNKITVKANKIDKEGYDHFMIKEIMETPYVIKQILLQDQERLAKLASAIKGAKQVYTIGSGTAGYAASQIAFYLRVYGRINAIGLIGAEARSYYPLFQKGDLIIVTSQSGETADVIEVLEYAKLKEVKIASLVNMPGSMISRLSDWPFMGNAGPEICVMSTKVFISQIAWGYLVAKTVQNKLEQGRRNLKNLEIKLDTYLHNKKMLAKIKQLVKLLANQRDLFLLGKYQNLAITQEGMVKLTEGSYIHAHAIPAGDLKHYAITLMEKGVFAIVVVSNDEVKNDLDTAINEIRLRGAQVIAIGHENQKNYDYYLETPETGETDAIGNVIPLQLLAYYLAIALGNNVDKPRHIAKSVTVK